MAVRTRYRASDFYVDLDCSSHGVYVGGDVKIVFYDHGPQRSKKFCHLWFNTGYIESTFLCFSRDAIDNACKVGALQCRNTGGVPLSALCFCVCVLCFCCVLCVHALAETQPQEVRPELLD